MEKNDSLKFNYEFLITSGVILICLVFLVMLPSKNIFQQIILALAFLLFTPLIYVKVILKRSIKSYGLGAGNYKTGLVWVMISFAACLLIFYVLFQYSDLPKKYYQDFFSLAAENFSFFLLYELVILGFYYFVFEIFFRGFVIFSLKNVLGIWAIAAQSILLFLTLWASSGLNWLIVPYLVFSLFAGIIAYYSKSIWYSFIASIVFNILFDITIINIFK